MQRFSAFALLLGLLAASPVVAQPRLGETWYAYMNGEDRYGAEHVRVERLADGNYQYTSELRILVDPFGAQEQEITGRTIVVVTPDFGLVSFVTVSRQMSGESSSEAEMRGSELVIRDGGGAASRFVFGDDETVIVGHALVDWLAQQPESRREVSVKVIDASTSAVAAVTLTREPANSWTLVPEGGLGTTQLTLDGERCLVESVSRVPALHIRRCTEAEAKDIDYHRMTGSSVLSFPIGADIPSAERLRALTVRLDWKNIPYAEFELEDSRQKVLSHREGTAGSSATVVVTAPSEITKSAALPVSDESLRPYLAETPFIKPEDSGIRAAARAIIGAETSSLAATRLISRWVFEYIDGALIAETLTGPQVLEGKRGKCTEYSTLFASLARSVGIPTRLALGERMVAGSWMGHMWNEVWVGRWIPVDASVDEVGGSFALLKFIHSDSVEGTQSLRWKLTESLAITIEDFEVAPLELTERVKTGIDGIVYANADYACRIRAPQSGWVLADRSAPGSPTIRFGVPGHDDVEIHFVAFDLPPGASPEAIIQARFATFQPHYEPFEIHRNEPCEVSGASGHRSSFGGPAKADPSRTYRVTEFVWRTEHFGYLLNLVAAEEDHDKLLPELERLVSSFESLAGE